MAHSIHVVTIDALDIARIAVKWPIGATLAWCLTVLTLSCLLVSVSAERTLGFAVNTIQEREVRERVAGQADVPVIVVTFKTHAIALFASVSLGIVKCSRWALLVALLLPQDGLVGKNITLCAL